MTRIYHMRPDGTPAVALTTFPGEGTAARQDGARLIRHLRTVVRTKTGKAPTYAYLYYASHLPGAWPVWAEQGGVKVYP